MNATIATRDPRLIRSVSECSPLQCHRAGRSNPGLNYRTSGSKRDRGAKLVAIGQMPKYRLARSTERAAHGYALGTLRRRDCRGFIGHPMLAMIRHCAFVGI